MPLRASVKSQHAIMNVRMYDYELIGLKKAAEIAGKSLSKWVRDICVLRANRLGVKIPKDKE